MDPIANMFAQIKNSVAVGHKDCLMPFSKIKEKILAILKEERYIQDFKVEEKNGKKNIRISHAYGEKEKPAFQDLARVSKPGRRIYSPTDKLPYILNGLGMAIVSTNKGLMTDKRARKEKLGGEIGCKIW